MLSKDVAKLCQGLLIIGLVTSAGCTSAGSSSSDRPPITAETTEIIADTVVEGPERSTTTEPELPPDQKPLPTTPAEMAEALTEAELAVVGTSSSGQAWGRRQQMLYQVLNRQDSWVAEVEAGISDEARATFNLNWKAKTALRSLASTMTLTDTMPAWRLKEPDSAETLLGYYKEAEAVSGVRWEYLAAINLVETRMGRIDGVSTAGAVGPMQFLPTTWAECCTGDPTEARDAIMGAAKYLTDRGAPDDMDRAILGYNSSEYYGDAVAAYTDVLFENEQAYFSYHGWDVYFRTVEGLIRMPADYHEVKPVPVKEWLGKNPDALFLQNP